MAVDYSKIKAENKRRYGTDIGRIGTMLLADRYDQRAHFIYELLQNAEDALRRRGPKWTGSRLVSFQLTKNQLRVSHFGKPFDEEDVRGICGIAESTKDLTEIGRFGIGFKSVFALTDRPEVHSKGEHFAIESFVWPRAVPPIEIKTDETVFVLPLNAGDPRAHHEIAEGLRNLGAQVLLFLREVDGIDWTISDGDSGAYRRVSSQQYSKHGREIVLTSTRSETQDTAREAYLAFSRPVHDKGEIVGNVEVAFALQVGTGNGSGEITRIAESPLVVFFPTVVSTNLGFLVQGPYRTTPSRDNIPKADTWNQYLVHETAMILVDALRELRDHGLLNINALRCLPLDPERFSGDSLLSPLFDAVKGALMDEKLLPAFRSGHVPAQNAMIARTRELRELLNPEQLSDLFESAEAIEWLDEQITQDRTPELRDYLVDELGIREITPDFLASQLTHSFLEKQPDKWVLLLYEFFDGQPALTRGWRVPRLPLIRLTDDTHVSPVKNGQPQAFLPGPTDTNFPTIKPSVCATDSAWSFLEALGLTKPDPVDDVIHNVLPKYENRTDVPDPNDYGSDIRQILTAFETDSKIQREKLLTALRECPFVLAADAADGSKSCVQPSQLYLRTQRLSELFEGISGVLFVDDSTDCLRGEDARTLLEACGASRNLQRIRTKSRFTPEQLLELRKQSGAERSTGSETVADYTLRGLDQLFAFMSDLDTESATRRAACLWSALGDLVNRRGANSLLGSYEWFYFQGRRCNFDADFIEQLNSAAWVPGPDSTLHIPGEVVFQDTQWERNPVLLDKINFKPPVLNVLAKEVGIEPGVLDLLKRLGLTSEAELISRLNYEQVEPNAPVEGDKVGDLTEHTTDGHVDRAGLDQSPFGSTSLEDPGTTNQPVVQSAEPAVSSSESSEQHEPSRSEGYQREDTQGSRTNTGSRSEFVSYISVSPQGDGSVSDGSDHQSLLDLEESAIQLILRREPSLVRTRINNPGFDLVEHDDSNRPIRFIEVKAMAETLKHRPVGLSNKQFELAQEKGDAYWLYVVELAASPTAAQIIRIQNPAGQSSTFLFDQGWLAVADQDS